MELLEERIRKDGIVKEGNVLKVDNFLNHQMDIELFDEMGKEFKRLFADKPINKILTIEASGIGIACVVARHFHVPVVFAKKTQSIMTPISSIAPPARFRLKKRFFISYSLKLPKFIVMIWTFPSAPSFTMFHNFL